MLLLLLGAVLCAVALLVAVEAVFRPAAGRRASFRRVSSYAAVESAPTQPVHERPSLLETIVPALSQIALLLTPRFQEEALQLRLAAAGVHRLDVQRFLALKTILGFIGILVAFLVAGIGVGGFLFAAVLVAAALLLPDVALTRRASARAEKLSAHLPQTIDQISISLEAGLGFDASVAYFVRRARSPLVGELGTMLSEIRMGESRTDALKRLAERVPSDEMRIFVRTIVQTEGAGISRAAMLRTQAEDLRHRRQAAAEERAQKAPVKMMFPTVIFILPVMFIVILGPAFQQAHGLFGELTRTVIELRADGGAPVRCELAAGFATRFLGLMGRSGLPSGQGMLFSPGGSIHTSFMRFPLDVVFIARDGKVLRVAERVPPWRLRRAPRRTRFMLELAGGEAARHGLLAGVQLELGERDWAALGKRRLGV